MTPRELQERIRILSELKASSGFRVLQTTLEQTAAQFESAVLAAKDPHTQSRAVGGWDVARQLSTWVERELTFARQQLELDSSEP